VSEQLSTLAYRNFVETCRTVATRQTYIKALRYFMDYLQLSPEAYDRLLDQDPKTTQMNICDYVSYLRKLKSPATVSAYVAAVRKFYSMNDIQLNWDKYTVLKVKKKSRQKIDLTRIRRFKSSYKRPRLETGLLSFLWPLAAYELVLFLFLESRTWSLSTAILFTK
jgi:hypothetical protein